MHKKYITYIHHLSYNTLPVDSYNSKTRRELAHSPFTHTSLNKDKGGSAEISVGEDEWAQKGPKVESQSQPAGGDLHPHRRHAALHGLGVYVRPVRRREDD